MATSDIFNLTDTWNAGATTFTAIKMNVTDTASASGSLLLDLQVGGITKFFVRKDGYIATASSFDASGYIAASSLIQTGTNFNLISNTGLVQFGASSDAILGRNAAASLRLGAADAAAPVAQTLGVQSVVAGTSNTAGANFTIRGSAGTGTGAGGSIIFQAAPAGSTGTAQNSFSAAWGIASNLTLYPAASLATNMTNGFLNIPGAAGIPSGTPANTTGFPMYYDSTNNKIYVYNGSWRSTAALT